MKGVLGGTSELMSDYFDKKAHTSQVNHTLGIGFYFENTLMCPRSEVGKLTKKLLKIIHGIFVGRRCAHLGQNTDGVACPTLKLS